MPVRKGCGLFHRHSHIQGVDYSRLVVDSKLWLIIASIVFGLGVDCPNIVWIVNWGAPNTLEDLVQESGRGGRNGSAVEAILFYSKTSYQGSERV